MIKNSVFSILSGGATGSVGHGVKPFVGFSRLTEYYNISKRHRILGGTGRGIVLLRMKIIAWN